MRFTTIISTICFALLFSCLAGSILHAQDTGNDYEDLYEQIRILAWSSGFNDVTPPGKQIKTLRLRDYKKAVAAYFWGLPLVEMRRSQEAIFGQYDLDANELYTPADRNLGTSVVAPNLDVLNATGFIDFSSDKLADNKRAIVLTVPNTQNEALDKGTYNIIQVLDAYTNVRGSFGTRPDSKTPDYQPNEGGNFLISGPDYEGVVGRFGIRKRYA